MSKSLTEAASRMSHVNFLTLLKSTEDIEQKDKKGRTALFRAARLGRIEHVKSLLEAGADANSCDMCGERPLQTSSRYGHLECVMVLLEAGAEIDHLPLAEQSNFAETALSSAVRKQPMIARYLLKIGADPNMATPEVNRNPLGLATESGASANLIDLLIQGGADVNCPNHVGSTPLHCSAEAGNIPVIKMLLDAGASVNGVDDRGDPVLCSALLSDDGCEVDVVFALLAGSPDLSLRCGSWNMTAIELAIEFDLEEVSEILKLAGSSEPEGDDLTPGGEFHQGVEFHCQFAKKRPPTNEEIRIVNKVISEGVGLTRRFGWRSSPLHWEVLKILEKESLEATRIAYFLRGWFNKPKGKEFDDWLILMGEDVLATMSRFIREGLVLVCDRPESLCHSYTAKELKDFCQQHGLKKTGTKDDLVQRLIQHIPIESLVLELPVTTLYSLSDAGRTCLLEESHDYSEAICSLRAKIKKSIQADSMMGACRLSRDLDWLLHVNPSAVYWSHSKRAEIYLSEAMAILENFFVNDDMMVPVNARDKAEIFNTAAAAALSRDFDIGWGNLSEGVSPPRWEDEDEDEMIIDISSFCSFYGSLRE